MNTPNTRRLAALAIARGMAFIVLAWIGATNPPFHGHLDTTVEYRSDAFLSAALVLTIAGLVALRRLQGAPRGAVETAVAGQLLLLIGVGAGLALGEVPSWFAAVGVPGNLLWLIGTVRIGRHTWRVRVFPRWTAVAIGLTVPAGIVLGEFGGGVLPGVLWIYLGLRFLGAASSLAKPVKHAVAICGVLVALGVGGTPALGATYTLNLSAPPTAVVGQPMIIPATGANPADDFFSSWLDVDAIPTSVLSTCPSGYLNASQVASSAFAQGGENLATALREDVDSAGSFSMPIGYTPRTPGRFLICGYTNDGATATLATASLILNVQGAGNPALKPANVNKPRVRRFGRKLVCNRGRWSNRPSRYSYGWRVNGKAKKGASGRKLRVARKLRGRRVQCTVTASNAAGATTAVSRPLRIR